MMSFSMAAVLGVPIGLTLGQECGWHVPFLVLAALCVPFFILAAWVLPRLDGHLKGQRREQPLTHLKAIFLEANHLRAFALHQPDDQRIQRSAILQRVPGLECWGGREALAMGFCRRRDGHPRRNAGHWPDGRPFRQAASVPICGSGQRVFFLTMTSLPRMPLALVLLAMSATMLSNGGRMVPAMAMITSSVVPRLRGGFMGANSAIQHLSSSFGVIIAGFILFEPKNGPIERYTFVGLMAATVSLSTLWLAGRLRLEGGAANELALEPVKSQISAAHGQGIVLKPAGTTRVVLSREDRVAPTSAHT